MRVIGVIDLLRGQAVRAHAGQRDRYRPVDTAAGQPVRGDATALAHVYTDRLAVTELYVADLDAILGGPPQTFTIGQLASLGVPLWLDAGTASVEAALKAIALGASRVIVGLETLPSFDVLQNVCNAVGGKSVAFSLDLRDGEPVLSPEADDDVRTDLSPAALAVRAAEAGVGSVIVLDLARVGTGSGMDLGLMTRVRHAIPNLTLLAGGGVRGPDDLRALASAGCDAVLVATALHEGRLRADERV